MLMIAIYIIVTLTALIFLLSNCLKNRELEKRIGHIPGPPTIPFLGSAHLFLGNTEEQMKIVLLSPKALEKDDIYKFSYPWIGSGLLTAPVSIWRIHRKLMQPAFNSKVLQSFVQVFQKHANILVKELAGEIGGKEFQLFHLLSNCTLNIICESAMGVSILSEKEKSQRYLKAAEGAFQIMVTRIFNVWLHPEIIFKLTKTSKMFYEYINYLHSVTNFVIQKKRRDLKTEASETNEVSGKRKRFLDLLMELSDNGKVLSDQQLREQVDTLTFGGHDTTSNMSSFVLLMLAYHPDKQDKAYEELYSIYGAEDPEEDPVKYEDLSRLDYLERIIKETLRLFPPTPLIARKTTDDLNIEGCTLPKNCSIMIPIFKLHRDEKHWPDPFTFDPNRFLSEEVDKRHPYAFIPFSSGPRNCIGLVFAMMSMKVILATILRKYVIKTDKIKPVKDIRLKIDILLKPVEPIAIRIEKRIK